MNTLRDLASELVDLFTRWLTLMALLLSTLAIFALLQSAGMSENAAGAVAVGWLIVGTIAALVIRSRLSQRS